MPDVSHANAVLIERFYGAFAAGDGETMAACYAPQATFSDPAFGELDAEHAGAMWRMFTSSDQEIAVRFGEVEAGERTGSARWQADYVFSPTGRPVHNEVEARFEFIDGLIARHRDSFDMWAWTRQALGLPGVLLGWSPPLRLAVRRRARAQLEAFMHGETT